MAAVERLTEEDIALLCILSDPSGVDLAEFSFKDPENDDGCFRLWSYQWPWFRNSDPLFVEKGSRSVGKALALDTPILTLDGWKVMGEIVEGDYVFGKDGQPVEVLEAHDVQFNRQCYEVIFDDGHSIIADEEHLWETSTHNKKTNQVRTTAEIVDTLTVPSGHGKKVANHRIDVAGPVALPGQELPIPPYVLGYWIGDGTTGASTLTCGPLDWAEMETQLGLEGLEVEQRRGDKNCFATRPKTEWEWIEPTLDEVRGNSLLDAETIFKVREMHKSGHRTYELGHLFNIKPNNLHGILTGKFHRSVGGWIRPARDKSDSLWARLRDLGILDKKAIPQIYMEASVEQRLALLQGLMDTDGDINKSGRCTFSQSDLPLCEQVYDLLLSLGQKPYLAYKAVNLNGKVFDSWRVGWTPNGITPFRFQRKIDRVKSSASTRVTQRRIAEVNPVESVPVRCIKVASEDSLFLAGRGLIPTHNTLGIQLRALAFPFNYPGREMAITAPTLNALTRVTDLIERRFKEVRLARELLPKKANFGFTHRPFQANFKTQCRILGVIPQLDGSGVRGLHPLILEVDEVQDMPEPAMKELIETVKKGSEGNRWLVHGVTTGARDFFYQITQEGSGWTVYNPVAQLRPNWTDQERQDKINAYGSRNDPDYRRNIYGDHGNAENPLFVMRRFMKCVDLNLSSSYNEDVFTTTTIRAEQLEDMGVPIADAIPIPGNHKTTWKTFWIGCDIGFTNDPTEILVFGESTKGEQESVLTLLHRITLTRIRHSDQAEAMAHLIMKYNPVAFAMDRTGLGLPLFQDLQDRFPSLAARVKGYNFSEKLTVDFDQTIDFDPDIDNLDDSKIVKNVLEHSSDVLRDLVDGQRLWLPDDDDVINSFKGETYSSQKKITDLYGRRKFRNSSKSHILDAARMTAMAWSQAKVDAFVDSMKDKEEPIIAQWV